MDLIATAIKTRNICAALCAGWIVIAVLDWTACSGRLLGVISAAGLSCVPIAWGFLAYREELKLLRLLQESKNRSAEDRLDELERLKRRDMVTPEEYAAKRQEILKDL